MKAPRPVPFPLPTKAEPDFAALPGDVRREVLVWARRFQRIWHLRPITGAIRRLARISDVGYSTALRKYYKLSASGGDWRVLVSHRKVPTCPLTVRVPMGPAPLRVSVLAHNERFFLLQIQRGGNTGK